MKVAFALLMVVGGLISSDAFGYRVYLEQFQGHYDFANIDTSDLVAEQSCGLCHNSASGGGSRNAYGVAFFSAVRGNAGFSGAELMDSDGDGFINLEEIYANLHPGLAESSPEGSIAVDVAGTQVSIDLGSQPCDDLKVTGLGVLVEGQNVYTTSQAQGVVALNLNQFGGVMVSCGKRVGSFIPQ